MEHSLKILLPVLFVSCFLLLVPSTSHAATLAKPPNNLGLVGYWSFNEGTSTKALDYSGKGNTGTLTNGPTWANGKLGKALSFDGSTTYVNTGSNPATQITNAPMTVSAWVKPNNDNGYRRIVSRGTTHFFLGTESNQLLLGMGDGVGSWNSLLTFGSDATLTNGQWYHVVVVHNGTTARGYVNGVDVGTVTAAFVSTNQSLLIGSYDGGNQTWNGLIDELRIYNRELSATEVLALYNSSSRSGTVQAGGNQTGLNGYWPMEEGSGTVAADVSGRGNTGTVVGSPARTAGKFGKGINNNGTGYITAASNASLQTSPFSLSIWVNPTNFSANQYLFVQGYSFQSGGYVFRLDQTTGVASMFFDRAGGEANATGPALTAGVWSLVTAVYNGTSMTVYTNGVAGTPTTAAYVPLSGTLGIGAATNGANPIIGSMDEARYYNRALTAGEVLALYNARAGGTQTANASSQTLQRGSTLANGLVGLWTFDGADTTDKVYDRSGQGNNGYIYNISTTSAKTIGKLGQALQFNGSNSYVDPGVLASTVSLSALTVSTWVNVAVGTPDYGAFIYKGDANGDGGRWSLGVGGAGLGDTRDVVALMGNGSNAYGYTTGNPLTTGVWHHVVSVFDGTQTGNAARLKVYVDNVQQTLTYNLTIPATVGAATNYHQIGLYGGTYYYKGLLDDMRLYNRALTAAEILQLYNLGK